jgi:hypothetical protein
MKLAFKKASGLFGNLINIWTGLNGFDHVELVFNNGMSFSSTYSGVRFAKIKYEDYPNDFIIVDIDCKELFNLTEKEVWDRCTQIAGSKYDGKGIMLYEFLPFRIEDPKSFYCSESVAYAIDFKPYQISPNKLYRKIIKLKIECIKNND